MFKVEFKVGGRKVPQRDFGRALHDTALKQVDDAVQRRLRTIRCPRHGQQARVRSARSHNDLEWKIEGCCDELVRAARRALK